MFNTYFPTNQHVPVFLFHQHGYRPKRLSYEETDLFNLRHSDGGDVISKKDEGTKLRVWKSFKNACFPAKENRKNYGNNPEQEIVLVKKKKRTSPIKLGSEWVRW